MHFECNLLTNRLHCVLIKRSDLLRIGGSEAPQSRIIYAFLMGSQWQRGAGPPFSGGGKNGKMPLHHPRLSQVYGQCHVPLPMALGTRNSQCPPVNGPNDYSFVNQGPDTRKQDDPPVIAYPEIFPWAEKWVYGFGKYFGIQKVSVNCFKFCETSRKG